MNILIMANIGNSDLLIDGKRVQRPRPEGETVMQQLAQHQIEFPILEPCLNYIRQQNPNAIARLICFYTDQPETPDTTRSDRFGVSLRDKDTIWFARIAGQILPARFPGWLREAQAVRIESSHGADLNPSIYDEAFEAYDHLLARYYDREAHLCFILTAGGIPACNFALQLRAIIAYGERCRFIYPPESGRIGELRIGEQIQATIQRANAMAALEQYNFPSALASARAARVSNWIVNMLEYAVYREAFDFRRALQAIEQAERQASGSVRQLCAELHHNLRQLSERNDPAALLREVFYSAEIACRNGRYAGMLGRIFRFQEGALRLIVERYLGVPTDMSRAVKESNLARYLEQIDSHPALRDYLEQQTIDNKPLRYRDGPNRPVMQAMIRFVIEGGARADGQPFANKKDRNRLQTVNHLLGQLDTLADLRNQSVIAHGYAGVSREEIDAIYKGGPEKIIEDLREMMYQLDIDKQPSPFDRVVQTIQDALQRGL
ncbi:hypothetical protein [Chloroflexus sp.]|uniref:hypothetical protein n=1 Tax=Chloroflexus sp. TaxID=1904827 RepID=UPI00260EA751|nr:hypothetical protein [uncultured Chloroflexus sp.]